MIDSKLNKFVGDALKGYQMYLDDKYIFYPRFFPSHIKSKPYTRKVIKELRRMGHDQIMERIKLLKADFYVPNDLLGITLKELGNFLFKILISEKKTKNL